MGIYSNSNVRFILISGFLYSIASSIIWFTPTWLVYSLGGSNADLGYYLGVSTISSLVASIVASIIADRFRYDILIWVGGVISVVGLVGLSSSYTLDQLFVSLVITMVGSSSLMPPIAGLLANSVPAASRNRVYGTQFLLNNGSGVVGNLLNFFLFQGEGNNIETLNSDLLRFSLRIAMIFAILAVVMSLLIRDSKALSEAEEDSVASRFTKNQEENRNQKGTQYGADDEITLVTDDNSPGGDLDDARDSQMDHTKDHKSKNHSILSQFAPGALPILSILVISGLFIGFGAGTSVPYFPRFFFDIYHLDLSNLSLVFAILTIITAVWGKINSNLADRFGRVELIVVNQLLAVVLLYVLALYPPLVFALLTLFVRNAVMNGAWPLNNAILMEFTPRNFRSLTVSITQVTWQLMFGLGQIFGGRLVDDVGFWLPFVITATLYLIATLIYMLIRRFENIADPPDSDPDRIGVA